MKNIKTLNLDIPWIERGKPTTVVVYKKTKTSKTFYMIVTDIHIDIINNGRSNEINEE